MCKKIEGSCQPPLDLNRVEYVCDEGFDVGKDYIFYPIIFIIIYTLIYRLIFNVKPNNPYLWNLNAFLFL